MRKLNAGPKLAYTVTHVLESFAFETWQRKSRMFFYLKGSFLLRILFEILLGMLFANWCLLGTCGTQEEHLTMAN